MKLVTEPYEEPQKDHGIGRMIVLSAVIHVVVIGALLVTGHLHFTKPRESLTTSYEVSLVGPSGTGKRRTTDDRAPASSSSSALEKAIAPPTKGEPRESLALKPEAQVKPQPQEKPKPPEQAKPKLKEPPVEKPREIAKESEPPKPKPAPVVQEKEPPEKKIEEVKTKESAKPKVETQLFEKKEKPKEKPLLENERVKVQDKKPAVQKAEEKPKPQPMPAKKPPEPVKTTAKEKINEPQKTEKADLPQKKPSITVPATAKAPTATDAAQAREDEEAREKMIASAVDRVRSREETASREHDIAKAIDRVRQDAGGREEHGKEIERQPATQARHEKEDGDGRVATSKVYGPEFLAYTENIKQKVKEGWIVPDRKPGLTAVVQFGVEVGGEVIDVELVQPSGDRAFDQSALRAVRNAKLPPPPEMYREDFVTQKVHMTFGGEE